MDNRVFLAHHGIKGQKWGIRRYQNPDGSLTPEGKIRYGSGPNDYGPIEDTVLKSGTVLRSVSSKHIDANSYKNSGKPLYVYNKENEWDNKVYKGPFSKYLVMYRGARFIAEFEYKTISDLKMPTKAERVGEFKSLYGDKKYSKDLKRTMGSIQKQLRAANIGSQASQTVDLNNLKTDDDFAAAYEVFNHAMEAQHNFKSTSEYVRRMSSKYDAMVDDNNQGIYNAANDPIVVFKTDKLISQNAGMPVKFLTLEEINDNTESVRKELKKRGERVKL